VHGSAVTGAFQRRRDLLVVHGEYTNGWCAG
jgi:hypothetical protein